MWAFHLEEVAYEGFHTETQGIHRNLELVSVTQNAEKKKLYNSIHVRIGLRNFSNQKVMHVLL